MYEGIIQDLIDEFGQLPGIGPKSAQRIAFYIIQSEFYDPKKLSELLAKIKTTITFCEQCKNISEETICKICTDPKRDHTLICVVEEPKDIMAVERTREYRGLYHVLGGAISPIDGIGPDDLTFTELMKRLNDSTITEIIIATNPNLEGEATATYLSRLLSPLNITTTRLASGLPVGGDLEYADEITLGRAFKGRSKL